MLLNGDSSNIQSLILPTSEFRYPGEAFRRGRRRTAGVIIRVYCPRPHTIYFAARSIDCLAWKRIGPSLYLQTASNLHTHDRLVVVFWFTSNPTTLRAKYGHGVTGNKRIALFRQDQLEGLHTLTTDDVVPILLGAIQQAFEDHEEGRVSSPGLKQGTL